VGEAILVGLQGVRSKEMLRASPMSKERGKRSEVLSVHGFAPILAFRYGPLAPAEGTKSSAMRFI